MLFVMLDTVQILTFVNKSLVYIRLLVWVETMTLFTRLLSAVILLALAGHVSIVGPGAAGERATAAAAIAGEGHGGAQRHR
jgi:hypothetical protein